MISSTTIVATQRRRRHEEEEETEKVYKKEHKIDEPDVVEVKVEGKKYKIKNKKSEWKDFAKDLGWDWFKEETGNNHIVVFNPHCFQVVNSYQRYNSEYSRYEIVEKDFLQYLDGRAFDAPLNISSTFKMFEGVRTPDNLCLGDVMDTSYVVNMEQMFYNGSLGDGFSLGKKFDISNVVNMYDMFGGCKFNSDFKLPENFDITYVEKIRGMFAGSRLPDRKRPKDFETIEEIVEWLKVRDNSKKTSYGKNALDFLASVLSEL